MSIDELNTIHQIQEAWFDAVRMSKRVLKLSAPVVILFPKMGRREREKPGASSVDHVEAPTQTQIPRSLSDQIVCSIDGLPIPRRPELILVTVRTLLMTPCMLLPQSPTEAFSHASAQAP